MGKVSTTGLDAQQKEFIKLLEATSRRHSRQRVFRDFVTMSSYAISNVVDKLHYAEREADYLNLAKHYERDDLGRMSAMLGCVTMSLEAQMKDCLGQLFMALDFGDEWKGQFFTPYSVATLMAQINFIGCAEGIQKEGLVTVHEPACGAGGMLIACAETLRHQGLNYQQVMHATAVDIDATAAGMCYLQLSLLHVPAIVICGNGLWPKDSDPWWVTPAHVLGRFDQRLRAHRAAKAPVPEPVEEAVAATPVVATLPVEPAPGAVPPLLVAEQRILAEREQFELF